MSIRMWLRRLWPRHPAAPAESHLRLELLLALRNLRPEHFARYHAGWGQTVYVDSVYPTLDQYSRALYEAFQVVRDERLVDASLLPRETTRVSLDQLLISADGYYLPIQPAVVRFKEAATLLCEALEASDYAEYGPAEHNLRMLTSTLANTLQLCRQLASAWQS